MREQQRLPCATPVCFSNIDSLVCFNKCSVWVKRFISSLGNSRVGGQWGHYLVWMKGTVFYKWQNQDEDGMTDKTLTSRYLTYLLLGFPGLFPGRHRKPQSTHLRKHALTTNPQLVYIVYLPYFWYKRKLPY